MNTSLTTAARRDVRPNRVRRRGGVLALVATALFALSSCGGDTAPKKDAAPAVTQPANAATDSSAPAPTEPAATQPATSPAPTEPPTTPAPTEPPLPAGSATLASEGAVTVTPPADATGLVLPGTKIVTAAGAASLTYADGSIIRLDKNTTFTLGDKNRGELALGVIWNRVAAQPAGEEFAVRIDPYGPVTAKGTAFAVGCVDELGLVVCTVMVVDGEVDALGGMAVKAGQQLKITNEVAAMLNGKATPMNWDGSFGNEFLKVSADGDASVNPAFADASTLAEKIGPSFASFRGSLTGTRTIKTLECAPTGAWFCAEPSAPVGDVADRTYVFETDCSKGSRASVERSPSGSSTRRRRRRSFPSCSTARRSPGS